MDVKLFIMLMLRKLRILLFTVRSMCSIRQLPLLLFRTSIAFFINFFSFTEQCFKVEKVTFKNSRFCKNFTCEWQIMFFSQSIIIDNVRGLSQLRIMRAASASINGWVLLLLYNITLFSLLMFSSPKRLAVFLLLL